jgi:hypothetical protein
MPRVVKRSASQAVKFSLSRHFLFCSSFLRNFPNSLKTRHRAHSGCTRSSWTAIAWPHGSTTAARMPPCNGLRGTDARGFNEGIPGM